MIQHFREQKKCWSDVEAKFEQSQICFNMVTTSFNIVERPIQMVPTFASTNVKQMLKQMLGLFEQALMVMFTLLLNRDIFAILMFNLDRETWQ